MKIKSITHGKACFFYPVIILLVLSISVSAQRITKNEVNGYTDERLIETDIVSLKSGFSTGFGVQYKAANKFFYLNFVGYGRSRTAITEDDRVHIILNNGNVIKLVGRVKLPANESSVPNIFIHHYYILKSDIELLKNFPASIIRVVSPAGQTDYAMGRKKEKAFMKLSKVFFEEIGK